MKYGFSFSINRLLGITGLRQSFAMKTGIPTTLGGLQRKIGQYILKTIFK